NHSSRQKRRIDRGKKMKLKICVLLILSILVSAVFAQESGNYAIIDFMVGQDLGGSVVYVEGELKKYKDDWQTVFQTDRISVGCKLKTGVESHSVVVFDDKTVCYMDEKAEFTLDKIEISDSKGRTQVDLTIENGRFIFDTGFNDKIYNFNIKTKNALVVSKNTQFMVEFINGKTTLIVVFEGKVELSNKNDKGDYENKTILKREQEAVVLGWNKPTPPSRMRSKLKKYSNKMEEVKKELIKNRIIEKVGTFRKSKTEEIKIFRQIEEANPVRRETIRDNGKKKKKPQYKKDKPVRRRRL
ncbi:FecR domain-containing protein, partial [bacterium]